MKYIVIFLLFLLGCPTKKYPDGSLLRHGDIVHINSAHASVQYLTNEHVVRIKMFGSSSEHSVHKVRDEYLKKCDCE